MQAYKQRVYTALMKSSISINTGLRDKMEHLQNLNCHNKHFKGKEPARLIFNYPGLLLRLKNLQKPDVQNRQSKSIMWQAGHRN